MQELNKDTFMDIIDKIEECDKYVNKANDFLSKFNIDGFISVPDCSEYTILLLNHIFNLTKDSNYISDYCFKYHFGKKYDGAYKDIKTNKIIPLANTEDLWNLVNRGGDTN